MKILKFQKRTSVSTVRLLNCWMIRWTKVWYSQPQNRVRIKPLRLDIAKLRKDPVYWMRLKPNRKLLVILMTKGLPL